jgi:hypothetical protein
MARFVINQTVVTSTPQVLVDAGVEPGPRRFRLVVVDERGNHSRPDDVVVTVIGTRSGEPGLPEPRRPIVNPVRPGGSQ